MIAFLLASAVVLPPDGTYTYAMERAGTQVRTSQVVFARHAGGLDLREHTDLQGGITTTRTFDSALRELDYAAQTPIARAGVTFAPGKATLTYQGVSQDYTVPSAAPVLVIDGLFGPAAILPAFVAAHHGANFTAFTTVNPTALDVTIDPGERPIRPSGVPSADASLTITIKGAQQVLWFDPATNVVDEFDPNAETRVRLISRTADVPTFTPAATPTPIASAYTSRDLTFKSRDGSTIAGTISYPNGAPGRVPGFVLVAGSGPHDRNEAIGIYHVLFDVAEGLNADGYAVLRYDKRFAGGSVSAVAPNNVTRQSYVDDVIAAVGALRADPQIDPKRIYLLGHSEGGELVLAAQLEGVRANAIAMLAPMSIPYMTALEDQVQRGMATQAFVDQLVSANATFMASWKDVDPRKEIVRIDAPMLVVRGSEDINVTADELSQLVGAAESAHRNLKVVTLHGDDHLYSSANDRFDRRVIQAIADWLSSLR